MTTNQHNSVKHVFSVPNWSEMCGLIDVFRYWQFFHYRPPGELRGTAGPIAKILCDNSIYICRERGERDRERDFKFMIFISSTWDCTTFHNFLPMFQKKKSFSKVGRSIIVPFHKSQYALRHLYPMGKIQNTFQPTLSGQVTDSHGQWAEWWLASACQPCECSASDRLTPGKTQNEVARHWSHTVHRPRPRGNLPLPCILRNGVWYCVKYS